MLANSEKGYGLIHILIHWVMAGLIWWAAILGLTMTDLPDLVEGNINFDKVSTYAFHKSLGLTVLALAVLRLLWKLGNKKPLLPETMKGWELKAATITHHLIYVLLFAVPILGWLTNDAAPFPLSYFGMFQVPSAGIGSGAAEFAMDVHEIAAKFLLLLVIVHALAALKHHFIEKDDVLKRMILPNRGT